MTSVRIVQAISFSCSLAILLGLVLGLGVENILWNPISWFFGGILLLFLSSFFYLVYCAVSHLWFPTREPGYPFQTMYTGERHKREEWVRQQNAEDERRKKEYWENFWKQYESEFRQKNDYKALDDETAEDRRKRGDENFEEAWEQYKEKFEQDEDENYAKYYLLLGLKQSATYDELRQRFRELALKYHPDKNKTKKIQAAKKFTKILEAYEKIIERMKVNV